MFQPNAGGKSKVKDIQPNLKQYIDNNDSVSVHTLFCLQFVTEMSFISGLLPRGEEGRAETEVLRGQGRGGDGRGPVQRVPERADERDPEPPLLILFISTFLYLSANSIKHEMSDTQCSCNLLSSDPLTSYSIISLSLSLSLAVEMSPFL